MTPLSSSDTYQGEWILELLPSSCKHLLHIVHWYNSPRSPWENEETQNELTQKPPKPQRIVRKFNPLWRNFSVLLSLSRSLIQNRQHLYHLLALQVAITYPPPPSRVECQINSNFPPICNLSFPIQYLGDAVHHQEMKFRIWSKIEKRSNL